MTPTQPCGDRNRPAVCVCSSRLCASGKALQEKPAALRTLAPVQKRLWRCTNYVITGQPGSQRFAADLKGNKWKRATCTCIPPRWESMKKHGLPLRARAALRSSPFQKAQEKKELGKEHFSAFWVRESTRIMNTGSQTPPSLWLPCYIHTIVLILFCTEKAPKESRCPQALTTFGFWHWPAGWKISARHGGYHDKPLHLA